MRFVKSSLAAALMIAIGGTALAEPFADPSTMTTDEKAAIQLLKDFRVCVRKVTDRNNLHKPEMEKQARQISAARNAAAEAATREAASKAGLNQDQVDSLLGLFAMEDVELANFGLNISLLPDPAKSCLKNMGIKDSDAAQKKIDDLRKKYGPAIV
jgi:hypothetical protein